MSDSITNMDVTENDQAMIQKEEENVQNLLEAAKKEIRAVKEVNAVNLKEVKDKNQAALALPRKSLKVAILYKRALKEKKKLLGLEPEPENSSKVKYLHYDLYILCHQNFGSNFG